MATEAENSDMMVNPAGYISELHLNDGETIDVNQNDIVVFVGTNNSGKSQSLKDIFELCKREIETVIVKDVKIVKKSFPSNDFFDAYTYLTNNGDHKNIRIFNEQFNISANTHKQFSNNPIYGELRVLYINNLTTDARLTICNPPNNIPMDSAKTHPIHYAAFDAEYRKWLSINFKKAFNEDIIPNAQFGSTIPLCMGPPALLNGSFKDEQEHLEKYRDILSTYPQVHQQGDGIRSFMEYSYI